MGRHKSGQVYDRSYQAKRDWYLMNKDKIEVKRRQSLLDGRWKGLNKRQYTGICELCGCEKDRLEYHHWDDQYPDMGLWLCFRCHRHAEALDHDVLDIAELYFSLKNSITTEYFNRRLL